MLYKVSNSGLLSQTIIRIIQPELLRINKVYQKLFKFLTRIFINKKESEKNE